MSTMSTFHDIAVMHATKQQGMVDAVTEEAPILDIAKFIPSTHGLMNAAEKFTHVVGPGFVEGDAPLPYMDTSSDLTYTQLYKMGGRMEVSHDKALRVGGPDKYFGDRQDKLLRQAGMDLEKQLVEKNWLKAALEVKNVRNAGATGKGWFILAVRFDELANVGLYDPDQYESGRFFKIDLLNNGAIHNLAGPKMQGLVGYACMWTTYLGWQILDAPRTCSAIVNIDESKAPTANMIDDMLADVRANASNTYIITGARGRIYGLNPYKQERIQLTNADKDIATYIESWAGIPIITSHNFNEKVDKITVS